MSKIDPEAFSDVSVFQSVDVDSGGTFGIDAFGLFVNDTLITNSDDLEYQRKSKRLNVRFVFIQTKRSSSIDSGDVLKFSTAVKDVFNEELQLPESDDLARVRELIREVFLPENSRLFGGVKPRCELYFVTTASKSEDAFLPSLLREQEKSLSDSVDEIGDTSVTLIGADYLIDTYSEIENRYDVDIVFDKNVPCERIEGVEQAFIGYLTAGEFLKLITSKDGELRRNIFYENVRDFQGEENSVNTEISETLSVPEMLDKFILLNNGVTIVAKKFLNLRANEYQISDYHIVNGCQTSNMIFKHKANFDQEISIRVPVKIIHTNSNDLISKIVRSTNRQTPVPDEAFASLEKFHKRLQDYYKTFSSTASEALFYERRSKEFANTESRVERTRIINLHQQIRSFASVILGEPHLIQTRNPVTILRNQKESMFQDGHHYSTYYLSSLLLFLFFRLEEKGDLDGRYEISRYWICWIARMLAFNRIDIGPLNSKRLDQECERIIQEVSNEDYLKKLFEKACHIYEAAKDSYIKENGRKRNGELVKTREFRDEVKALMMKRAYINKK
ncbi:AIPR family protein [Herbaspirillum robiniae]|uniref:AIPR family protein n=1 Tax=Herbaspirillum robiniae TaxID=2014887 RepID=UPI001A9C7061|nr:AIPR family protein [Herbaspirillum robiniae]